MKHDKLVKPRTGKTVKCAICHKEIYRRPSALRENNYCSPECHNNNQRKGPMLICKVCGNEYYRPPSQVKWRGSSCCSYKCIKIYYKTSQKGENSATWQGGKSSIYKRLRSSATFTEWRKAVFERDNYTCQDCGARNGNGKAVILHPHHIKSFTKYPALRFDISNGLTLCVHCHKRQTSWQSLRRDLRADKNRPVR